MSSLEDPEIDALVDKILATPDLTEQKKLSQQFQLSLAQKYDCFAPILTTNAHAAAYSYVKATDPAYDPRNAWQAGRYIDKS
jgi:ABC-type oligopeptide transport system substrate-binding subunit